MSALRRREEKGGGENGADGEEWHTAAIGRIANILINCFTARNLSYHLDGE